MEMLKYFARRIYNDFEDFIPCIIIGIVVTINYYIISLFETERLPGDIFILSVVLFFLEVLVLCIIYYLMNIYDDFKKEETNDYVSKLTSKKEEYKDD